MIMDTLANFSRRAEDILDKIVAIILVIIILFAGYSLWSSYTLYRGGFVSDDLLKYKPHISEDGTNPSLRELMAINPDIVGWITIDDTNIDHPILQGEDNLDYINKDVYGNFSLPGSIFLDSRNDKDFNDPYSLLYGHHMDGGGMFGDLLLFEDKKFFDDHKTGTLFLLDETYHIDLYMVSKVDAYDSVIFNPTSIQNQGQRQDLIDYARNLIIHERPVQIDGENIIALSTCEKATTNGRTVLFGFLRAHL